MRRRTRSTRARSAPGKTGFRKSATRMKKRLRPEPLFYCRGKPPAPLEDSQSSTISGRVRVAVSNGNMIPVLKASGGFSLLMNPERRSPTRRGFLQTHLQRAGSEIGAPFRGTRRAPARGNPSLPMGIGKRAKDAASDCWQFKRNRQPEESLML